MSGELWERTSSFLARKGTKYCGLIFQFQLWVKPLTHYWNAKSISDIKTLPDHYPEFDWWIESIPFWKIPVWCSSHCLPGIWSFYMEPQFRTLQNLQRLIENLRRWGLWDKLIVATKDESLLSMYKSTIVMVTAHCNQLLQLRALHFICSMIQRSAKRPLLIPLILLYWGEVPVVIYVCNPLKDLRYFKPLSALFFQHLFNHTLSRLPGKREREIFFVLDEFASMKFPWYSCDNLKYS